MESTPPKQVSTGQVLTLVFSGDYIIGNNAIVCDGEVVRYRFSDQLPSFSWERTVRVLLDEQVLATFELLITDH